MHFNFGSILSPSMHNNSYLPTLHNTKLSSSSSLKSAKNTHNHLHFDLHKS
ncbi:hypothetical protein HanIR_Chr06g0285501 [Helianthus annuus]|nr:hypothetical protein HanIR_Chr06g0285501 [Helianthus annuus]